jgi:protein ImuB
LSGQTVVLYEQPPQGGVRIVVAGEFALEPKRLLRPHATVLPGMPLAEGLSLLMRNSERGIRNKRTIPPTTTGNPQFHLEAYDPAADLQALRGLARWCHRFSPLVGLEEGERPRSLLLDATGLTGLFGGEAAWLEQIVEAFRTRGLTVLAALADTVGAAWAVARQIHPVRNSAVSNPQSLLIVPPGETHSALRSLPVSALRLPAETLMLLARLGLRRIGQVAALPRQELPSRFGPELLRRLDQAMGRAPEVINAQRLPVEFAAECSFDTPTDHWPTLEAASRQLIERVAAALARRNEGAVELQCRFELASRQMVCVPIGLYRPSHSASYLEELLRLRLESVRLAEPVTTLGIEATAVAALKFKQQSLFGGESLATQQRHLASLVDRLSNRLGRQAVLRAAPLRDAQPEYACVYFPLAGECVSKEMPLHRGSKARVRRVEPATFRWFRPGERPLRLLSRPIRLSSGASPNEPLSELCIGGQPHRVAHHWGPERIETGWWRTGLIRRDYYHIETTTGSRFWIFRELDTGQWYLQGEFS